MKIAVTYENGQIFQHFGHTEKFKVYQVEDGKVVSSAILSANGVGHGALAGLLRDSKALEENLVRLHVVANSDSQEDQDLKLQVRDAVVEQLNQVMGTLDSAQAAKDFLSAHLTEIQQTANEVLQEAGSQLKAQVSLALEEFPTRVYDTFQLPAGLYEALRITIGEGEGHNWWCVVFPTLCVPASSEGFQETAEAAGLSDRLAGTLTQDSGGYEIRFRLLDWLGQVKNWFHG